MIQLCWMPTWSCQNYGKAGEQSTKCPYCPLGLMNGFLSYNGWQTASRNSIAKAEDVASFIVRHAQLFGHELTLSGGEPLASPITKPVIHYLNNNGFTWGITSNTTLLKRIQELDLRRCRSWTASYHPFAMSATEFAAGARQVKAQGAIAIYANLVISKETIKTADTVTDWLHELGVFHRVNLLVDMYREQELAERACEIAAKYPKTLAVGSGKTVTGAQCKRFSRFMVISPDGTLYECVRKAYHHIDPIGHVSRLTIRDDDKAYYCSLDCPHTCDQTKHT